MGPLVLGLAFAMQLPQAAVTGIVQAADGGAPLAGAVVALNDLGRVGVTDSQGRYRLPGVPAGPQHLTITRLGYAERTVHALVPPGGDLELDVVLQPHPIPLAGLDVRSAVERDGHADREPAGPTGGRAVSPAGLKNHPLLAQPDAFLALAVADAWVRPEAPAGLHVRGGSADQTAYLLDGIPVLNPLHSAGTFSAWDPDALDAIRLDASPGAGRTDALSGIVEATTRAPGPRVGGRGGLSTVQAGATVDGPLGGTGAGFLVSMRSGFPGFVVPADEPSYLRGEIGDRLVKLETPFAGGRLIALDFSAETELRAAADPSGRATHGFEWRSHSSGLHWENGSGVRPLRVRAWHASAGTDAQWNASAAVLDLRARREDAGLSVDIELGARPTRSTSLGVRAERRHTSYRPGHDADWRTDDVLPLIAVHARHRRAVGDRVRLETDLAVTATGRGTFVAPALHAEWQATTSLTLAAAVARRHQFAQSLRNPESLAGTIFPVDLHAGAGRDVPVAVNDAAAAGVTVTPAGGLRITGRAWRHGMDGLVLVAADETGPFAITKPATGTGRIRGMSIEATAGGARYAITGGWAWQSVRLRSAGISFTPEHAARHTAHLGMTAYPTATAAVRVAVTGAAGRRAAAHEGVTEWEACNLLDTGCEFAGTPGTTGTPGDEVLPAYVRVDAGVRRHWHVRVGGRDAIIAAFGTLSNVFGRTNVLAWGRNTDGSTSPIELLPFAPLVIGIDWSF